MAGQENAKKLMELSLWPSSSSSSEEGGSRQRQAKDLPPPHSEAFHAPREKENEVTLDKEINEAIASDQIMSEEKVNSPMDPRVVNSPSDSPSLSDLSETPSETQRKICQGEAVSAAELFEENERLRNFLAKSERDINIERIRS